MNVVLWIVQGLLAAMFLMAGIAKTTQHATNSPTTAVIMLGAMGVHARRKEPGAIAFNAILLIAAGFVAWGRFGPYAF